MISKRDVLISELKASFYLYDEDNDGHIYLKDLGTVIRLVGQNPTQAELKTIEASINDQEATGEQVFYGRY